MEHVAGIQLHQKWPHISGDQKVNFIDAIYRRPKEVADIDFPAYGSLFDSTSLLGSSFTLTIEDDFTLGPTTETIGIISKGVAIRARVSTFQHQYLRRWRLMPWDTGLAIKEFADNLVEASLPRIHPTDSWPSNRPSYHSLFKHTWSFSNMVERSWMLCLQIARCKM